jgi:3-deoxy-D-manno-octulosonic-acid transferase
LRLLWRSRLNPGYAQRIRERFGFYSRSYRQGDLIIHAVSVGETVAAAPLIERLLLNHSITVTSTTPTGSARVKALFGDRVQHVYLPYDYPFALKAFFKTFQPKYLILMETEWWPNVFVQAKKAGVDLCMANARLSERSLKGYSRIASLFRPMAQSLAKVCAQTEKDAQHFIQLGVPADRVEVTGNIKFDLKIKPSVSEAAQALKSQFHHRSVWIAASTHAGEEDLVLQTVQVLLKTLPNVLSIIVPRHPERFEAFYQALSKAGLKIARRSLNQSVQADTQVYYGDIMGDLLLLYGASEVAFVAGSFVPAGGHNMLEAAAMGAAIVMGPHLENVSTQAKNLVQAQGMIVVESPKDLPRVIGDLLQSPEKRSHYVEQASQFLHANQGAVDRTIHSLEGVMK